MLALQVAHAEWAPNEANSNILRRLNLCGVSLPVQMQKVVLARIVIRFLNPSSIHCAIGQEYHHVNLKIQDTPFRLRVRQKFIYIR